MPNDVSVDFEMFNEAANNNGPFILSELRRLLPDAGHVLEMGSGSGQHVAFFAGQIPGIVWQPTDKEPCFDPLCRNLEQLNLPNILIPQYLDIEAFQVNGHYGAIYCANVIHIMKESLIEPMFEGIAETLKAPGLFVVYGPFKYDGKFTTPSNARFDDWLKSRDPLSGIRDIERLQSAASHKGLELIEDVAMPANNQLLVFHKTDLRQGTCD